MATYFYTNHDDPQDEIVNKMAATLAKHHGCEVNSFVNGYKAAMNLLIDYIQIVGYAEGVSFIDGDSPPNLDITSEQWGILKLCDKKANEASE